MSVLMHIYMSVLMHIYIYEYIQLKLPVSLFMNVNIDVKAYIYWKACLLRREHTAFV